MKQGSCIKASPSLENPITEKKRLRSSIKPFPLPGTTSALIFNET